MDLVVHVADRDQQPVTSALNVKVTVRSTDRIARGKRRTESVRTYVAELGADGLWHVALKGLAKGSLVETSVAVTTLDPRGNDLRRVVFPSADGAMARGYIVPAGGLFSCMADLDCDAAAFCDGEGSNATHACQPRRATGLPCAKASACESGRCAQNGQCSKR